MSVMTIYRCDRCEKEVAATDQLWAIGVVAVCSSSYGLNLRSFGGSSNFIKDLQMHVCRPCLEELGIHVQNRPDVKPPEPPALEELIREIVERSGALDAYLTKEP